jgi:hypothetical protein
VSKWLRWMDLVLLLTCLGLLLIDLQIKNDIVQQAKELERILGDTRGKPQRNNIPDNVRVDILRNHDYGEPAVANEDTPESPVKRTRSRKGNPATVERNTGNGGAGIQSDGEQVGT